MITVKLEPTGCGCRMSWDGTEKLAALIVDFKPGQEPSQEEAEEMAQSCRAVWKAWITREGNLRFLVPAAGEYTGAEVAAFAWHILLKGYGVTDDVATTQIASELIECGMALVNDAWEPEPAKIVEGLRYATKDPEAREALRSLREANPSAQSGDVQEVFVAACVKAVFRDEPKRLRLYEPSLN
jgi:hypothetical protein